MRRDEAAARCAHRLAPLASGSKRHAKSRAVPRKRAALRRPFFWTTSCYRKSNVFFTPTMNAGSSSTPSVISRSLPTIENVPEKSSRIFLVIHTL
jgi:hypothetical protein